MGFKLGALMGMPHDRWVKQTVLPMSSPYEDRRLPLKSCRIGRKRVVSRFTVGRHRRCLWNQTINHWASFVGKPKNKQISFLKLLCSALDSRIMTRALTELKHKPGGSFTNAADTCCN